MQQVTSQDVQEWWDNPVTVLHRNRLRKAALDRVSVHNLDTNKQTLEAIGLEALARKFEAGGILQAYDHDPEMFYQWLVEVGGE